MKHFKILIAPNSFKECVDSIEVSNMIEKSLRKEFASHGEFEFQLIKKPITDGGDGFLNVCKKIFGLIILKYKITSPYNDSKIVCPIGYCSDKKRIFIESAKVLGISLIPKEKRIPTSLSSKGIGELLKRISDDVKDNGVKVDEIIIGIGGTGTNDLGLGALEAFGLKLIDKNEEALKVIPQNFLSARKIIWKKPDLPFSLKTILDVDNPLLGDKGAARVFARQKGASDEDIDLLEKGFRNILQLLDWNEDNKKFLSGAGGGLAAGLSLFLDAEYIPAQDFILKNLKISPEEKYDCVITGEGSFDSQSLLNKGAMIIVKAFKNSGIPIYILSGKKTGTLSLGCNVQIVELSKYFHSEEESIKNIDIGISLACKEISTQFNF